MNVVAMPARAPTLTHLQLSVSQHTTKPQNLPIINVKDKFYRRFAIDNHFFARFGKCYRERVISTLIGCCVVLDHILYKPFR